VVTSVPYHVDLEAASENGEKGGHEKGGHEKGGNEKGGRPEPEPEASRPQP
jgi:hypothetical protein